MAKSKKSIKAISKTGSKMVNGVAGKAKNATKVAKRGSKMR